MSSHIHPPGTPEPADRDAFLIDGCPRCAEYVEDLGVSFDQDRFRAFWLKMVDVEYDDASGYASHADAKLGRRLYLVSLALQRAFGLDPRKLPPASALRVPPADTPQHRADRELALAYVDSCGPEADRLLMAVVYALLAVEDRIDSLVYMQNGGNPV